MLSKDKLLLYTITNRLADERPGGAAFLGKVEAALKGGATILQLREKALSDSEFEQEALSDSEFEQEALAVKEICRKYGVPLIINDNPDIALKTGADGVHVGADDLSVAKIRARVTRDFIIGATAKTIEQAREAEASGADYLGVGAIFPSPTKAKAIRVSIRELKEICGSVKIPVVAIGGIDCSNINELAGIGIAGAAVVSAIFGAEDAEVATRRLRGAAEALCRQKS